MYDVLVSLGLSPSERIAYETLVSKGVMAPPQLAKTTGLSRVNGYAALRGLHEKGLATEKEMKKKKVYQAEPPIKLQELLNKQRQEIQEREAIFSNVLPLMMNDYQLTTNKPGIAHYEGLEGIKKVYEETLRAPYPKEICVLRSIYDDERLDSFIRDYTAHRAKLGITNRTLTPTTLKHPKLSEEQLLRSFRVLSSKSFSLPTEIDIYGDKVALISLRKDLIATVIQSKDVAQSWQIIFELLWAQAATIPKK
ncbi:hypothetical protein COU91_01475 [Candidatus Saccharibacteria bacterium CG10_big_fil_rev_8_21_14_0_10_47_8]|nr:MAG: hypothetical protein COU91_01475 [Candidatus Saccharibacteria bacterium CG10_big_fil_rev_8_21_14_0_10_47_8]